MNCAHNFATAKDVSAAIHGLGMAANTEVIVAISKGCRDKFLGHLQACITSADPTGEHLGTLKSILSCLDQSTLKELNAIVPGVQMEAVAKVAGMAPKRLYSAIKAANDAGNPKQGAARELLASAFDVATTLSAPPAAETSSQQKSIEPSTTYPGPDPSPEDMSHTRAQTSNEAEKKYESCHVYGSSFALCFNASSWDGRPGIMVDAAASSGPKSYDWRNATHIWLGATEVAAALAVFRRWRPGVEFGSHGAQNDKSFSLEYQGQHFYAKLSVRKAAQSPVRAVKILPTDATAVSIMFLKTLAECYPDVPITEVMATIRAAHEAERN